MAEINKIQIDNDMYDIQDSQSRASIRDIINGIPKSTSQLTNDSGFIDKTVDELENYYTKSVIANNYYDKNHIDTEVDDLKAQISSIPKFKRKVVDTLTLPEDERDEDTLYLLRIDPSTSNEDGNLFEEWIWIVNKDTGIGSWEYLGAQKLTVDSMITQTLERVYPVGSIYMSMSNIEPETVLGFGTWKRIEERFLLAAGENQQSGQTGGAANVTLTSAQLPKMGGSFEVHGIGAEAGSVLNKVHDVGGYEPLLSNLGEVVENRYRSGGENVNTEPERDVQSLRGVTIQFGEGKAHENMPPYLRVYMWQRTA